MYIASILSYLFHATVKKINPSICTKISIKLIHLDSAINLAYEPQAREETNRSRQQKESNRDHRHVREINGGGNHARDVQLRDEIPHRVQEQVSTGRASGQK